jgi:lysophospholipase L1-like esterase
LHRHTLRRALLAALICVTTLLSVPATAGAATREYVALGDSYSSGNGTRAPDLNLFCYRSSRAYPAVVASQRSDLALRFVACGGATTQDVLRNQVGALSSKTAYVTITIGGNDIGFADMVLSCPASGESTQCWNAIATSRDKIDNTLPAALDRTYAEIRSRSPRAQVVVLGYGLHVTTLCAATAGVTQAEAVAMNDVADRLDTKIAERVAAAGSGFTYVPAITPFAGHEPCSSTPWINGYSGNLLNDWHPNIAGHRDGYVPMVRQVIG